ncbi:VTT domain-containing protein [Terrilactibacillus laevilacticus]|uniref:VTT domain-containing protein n=1 Tax=Terrilactibacillus laevilacticus TaxID=1380157 RepID=A0ABW5PR31_9BACI|nr:VTT domain-containing protein [Terrilactibacillus laevilacticus]
METLIHLLNHYTYIILFSMLMLELIALPIPTEILMSYVGYLVYQGDINLILALISGILGSCSGMTCSYWIGKKLGAPFFLKYGHRFHLGPERLDKLSRAFNLYGKRLLLFSCFIPGVRHITGYFAGITRIPYRSYAFFSYIGAVIWVSTFIGFGRILGPKYKLIESTVKEYLVIFIIIIGILVVVYYVVKFNLPMIKFIILRSLKSLYMRFQSRFQLKLLIACSVIVFSLLTSLMFLIIDAYVDQDYIRFNHNILTLFGAMPTDVWHPIMEQALVLSKFPAFIVVCLLTLLWIGFKGKQKEIEIKLFFIMLIGGMVFVTYLPLVIEKWLTKGGLLNLDYATAPNKQVIMVFILYGYFMFLVSRHVKMYLLKIFINVIGLILLFIVGVSHVYYEFQLPSDLITDYILAGIWLSFVIICLETWRLIIITNESLRQNKY